MSQPSTAPQFQRTHFATYNLSTDNVFFANICGVTGASGISHCTTGAANNCP